MVNAFLDKVEKESLGKKIRLARIASGITQQELAARLYITQSSISDFEKDVSEPRWSLMLRMIKILDTDINFFVPAGLK